MDEDLAGMSREQLREEGRKFRRGIRSHRGAGRLFGSTVFRAITTGPGENP